MNHSVFPAHGYSKYVRLITAGIVCCLTSLTQSQTLSSDSTTSDPDLGPNVYLIRPEMSQEEVQSVCDTIYAKQEKSEFGLERYAILFKPGSYKAKVNIGFYTQVCGLGRLPDDVTITGAVGCDARWNKGNALVNFWRGCENLTIVPYPYKVNKWAVSQAAPFRRIHIKGSLTLFDTSYSSGGYLADCKVDEEVVSGSQQQWFSRNSEWGAWKGGVWNMVFLGTVTPPKETWPERPFTTQPSTPSIAEKPFLYIDENRGYQVFVPALRKDSKGYSWGPDEKGHSIPLSEFYIARPDQDNSATLNTALEKGKHLLLTPGIYHIDDTIQVKRPNTIILGLGLATLNPQKGKNGMEIADVDGVRIAGVLFDAGAISSPVLLRVGEPGSTLTHETNPTILYDVFCRVGGAVVGVAKTCLEINSNDVIGDNNWLWRADHGAGAGWDKNASANGLIVNGKNVLYYGLFVEHFQEAQTLWNGENGRVYFYQCEMPYDPPTQDAWRHDNVRGWPGYKVSDNVTNHEAWGLGVYCVFLQPNIYADNAIEAPKIPGVKFHHALTIRLGGATADSGIVSTINGMGAPASLVLSAGQVLEYPSSNITE